MPLLEPFLTAAGIGNPKPVIASQRRQRNRRTMRNPQFYEEDQQQETIQPSAPQQPPQQIPTGDLIKEQLVAMQQRAAPPKLEPGARVRSANMDLVEPENFKVFYNQLSAIDQIGKEQLGAAQAKAAIARLQAMNRPSASPTGGGTSTRRGGGGGQDFGGGIPSNPAANFRYAQEIGPRYGWTGAELNAWYTLGMKESGWRNTAQNPTSTAYGIGQFLNSTWAGVGIAKTSDPRMQVEAMARYIRNRYGSPSRALAFHRAKNWY
jgi:hypothetical protein